MCRNLLLLLAIGISTLTSSEIVDWDFAFNSGGPANDALFTAVESSSSTPGAPFFASGQFQGELSLPGLSTQLIAPTAPQGLVAGFAFAPGGWTTQWSNQTTSQGAVQINDLAVTEASGLIYVAGSYEDELSFDQNPSLTLPNPGGPQGFVAVLNQGSGLWQTSYPLGNIIPVSIDLDSTDSFYVTSATKLAAKFDQNGSLQWDFNASTDTQEVHHIATRVNEEGMVDSYVLSTIGGPSFNTNNVRVTALDPLGNPIWEKETASLSNDIAGGLGVSDQGFISFSLATNNADVTYDGATLDPNPSNGALETYVVRIRPDGNRLWSTRAAVGNNTGPNGAADMISTDLDHDPFGNIHLAITFNGDFLFEGQVRNGNGDVGILSVGDGGTPYHLLKSTGNSIAEARGITAPLRDEQVIVGKHDEPGDIVFGSDSLPANNNPRALAAISKQLPNQSCFIIRQRDDDSTDPNVFLAELRAVLQVQQGAIPQIQTPAEIYREFNFPNLVPGPIGLDIGVVGFAAFLTQADLDTLEASNLYQIEEDLLIRTSGDVDPSSYNLAKLNSAAATGPFSYEFPELCQPVRLYLIDTAVYDPGGTYFVSNSNLTILDPVTGGYGELVRAPGETAGIVTSEHGTNVLSLVAGPEFGVAQHTPITAKIYDIFPSPGTARASALTQAILFARDDRLDPANIFTPAAILITSNSVNPVNPGDLPALELAIDACCTDEIPIVMSAGNNGASASSYAPAKFGAKSCVLCTGASNLTSTSLAGISNTGSEVKIVAPGVNTLVATEVSGLQTSKTFTGTSASAALAAGALIHFHSANPWLLGSDLVSKFLSESTHATDIVESGVPYQQVKSGPGRPQCETDFSSWAIWFDLTNDDYEDNDDGDLYTNLEEYVHGFDPTVADGYPHAFGIDSYSHPILTMGFPIAWWLWDPTATADTHENYLLCDGVTKIRVASANNLNPFSGQSVSLTTDEACGYQSYLSFPIDVTLTPKKFFRVEATAP